MDFSEASPELVAATAAAGVLIVAVIFFMSRRGPRTLLPLDDFVPLKLIRKEQLSHDTRRFTLALPDPKSVLGLPTGQHLSLKFKDSATGKVVQRSYTPVSDNHTVGEVSLVIKVYRPTERFPQGGLLSQHLDDLKVGVDSILAKGPKGHLTYESPRTGTFTVKPMGKPLQSRTADQIGMIAGGTGITPMLQVLHRIFRDPQSKVCCKLLYANQSEEDILVRPELEALAREFPDRFQLWYTLDRPPKGSWKFSEGFIDQKMLEEHVAFPKGNGKSTQFFLCGPPPMIKYACLPNLENLGFSDQDWVVF